MNREAAWRRMRLDQVYLQYEELRRSSPLLEKKTVTEKGGPSAKPQLHGNLDKVKEEKGKGVADEGCHGREEHMYVSDQGRKRPLIVLSSDSESSNEDVDAEEEMVQSDDEEVREEDDGRGRIVFIWKRKMSGRVVQRNVFQLPQKVIKKCLMIGHERIQIADSDTGVDYDCVLHRAVRPYAVERFIGQGWYEFAKSRDIKRGDRVGFLLRVPPTEKIVVSILNL